MCMIKEELETRTCTVTSETAYLLGVEKKHFESEYTLNQCGWSLATTEIFPLLLDNAPENRFYKPPYPK